MGSADALVSLWDVNELACLHTSGRLDWPISSVSFSYDGKLLASASEDLFIDIGHVETGKNDSMLILTLRHRGLNITFRECQDPLR